MYIQVNLYNGICATDNFNYTAQKTVKSKLNSKKCHIDALIAMVGPSAARSEPNAPVAPR